MGWESGNPGGDGMTSSRAIASAQRARARSDRAERPRRRWPPAVAPGAPVRAPAASGRPGPGTPRPGPGPRPARPATARKWATRWSCPVSRAASAPSEAWAAAAGKPPSHSSARRGGPGSGGRRVSAPSARARPRARLSSRWAGGGSSPASIAAAPADLQLLRIVGVGGGHRGPGCAARPPRRRPATGVPGRSSRRPRNASGLPSGRVEELHPPGPGLDHAVEVGIGPRHAAGLDQHPGRPRRIAGDQGLRAGASRMSYATRRSPEAASTRPRGRYSGVGRGLGRRDQRRGALQQGAGPGPPAGRVQASAAAAGQAPAGLPRGRGVEVGGALQRGSRRRRSRPAAGRPKPSAPGRRRARRPAQRPPPPGARPAGRPRRRRPARPARVRMGRSGAARRGRPGRRPERISGSRKAIPAPSTRTRPASSAGSRGDSGAAPSSAPARRDQAEVAGTLGRRDQEQRPGGLGELARPGEQGVLQGHGPAPACPAGASRPSSCPGGQGRGHLDQRQGIAPRSPPTARPARAAPGRQCRNGSIEQRVAGRAVEAHEGQGREADGARGAAPPRSRRGSRCPRRPGGGRRTRARPPTPRRAAARRPRRTGEVPRRRPRRAG